MLPLDAHLWDAATILLDDPTQRLAAHVATMAAHSKDGSPVGGRPCTLSGAVAPEARHVQRPSRASAPGHLTTTAAVPQANSSPAAARSGHAAAGEHAGSSSPCAPGGPTRIGRRRHNSAPVPWGMRALSAAGSSPPAAGPPILMRVHPREYDLGWSAPQVLEAAMLQRAGASSQSSAQGRLPRRLLTSLSSFASPRSSFRGSSTAPSSGLATIPELLVVTPQQQQDEEWEFSGVGGLHERGDSGNDGGDDGDDSAAALLQLMAPPCPSRAPLVRRPDVQRLPPEPPLPAQQAQQQGAQPLSSLLQQGLETKPGALQHQLSGRSSGSQHAATSQWWESAPGVRSDDGVFFLL